MRGLSLAMVMGLALAGCGPEAEKQEQVRAPETEEGAAFTEDENLVVDDEAQEQDGTVEALAAKCQMPLTHSPRPEGGLRLDTTASTSQQPAARRSEPWRRARSCWWTRATASDATSW